MTSSASDDGDNVVMNDADGVDTTGTTTTTATKPPSPKRTRCGRPNSAPTRWQPDVDAKETKTKKTSNGKAKNTKDTAGKKSSSIKKKKAVSNAKKRRKSKRDDADEEEGYAEEEEEEEE
eukprot:TRINITY_DN362_c1_g1_i1.p2 TRINITY_DN362_c1_g1~~TRINITY_DN362_c1_g1_i1.p2  ORF type:complete len:120 (+),score=48.18 TRINITY_DN362_c1_g1_i1:342-701(+)